MAFNDAFGLFGHYAFSSKSTHGRSIYESMVDGMGTSYTKNFNSLQQGRMYANAVCMATAQYQLDRALNNRKPATATEMIVALERDFQVTPGPAATLKQRRDFLSALVLVSKGNSQSAIEAALSKALGTDFVSYTHLAPDPFPSSPGTVGVFCPDGTKVKQFTITPYVAETGVFLTVAYQSVDGFDAPLAGETYTVDPDPCNSIEQITIHSATETTITAAFSRAHEAGTTATRPYPFWSSVARHSVIKLTLAASQDPEKRRLVNELMSRAARGVSQWSIVSDQGTFILDSATRGILGSTSLA